ncbi:MAG: hypothetical protein H9901_05595 [Candidatus Paralactobacillus gallistercoris]|uniref:Uncharacterized protein n=1 Tax=Candidatus Paralactobacillus gallistercoris TaxID=2838724 RepID=A0A948TK07_9LACO|nr:hypothetical protein [Candidatus Paralactobacillus gallistercoris]
MQELNTLIKQCNALLVDIPEHKKLLAGLFYYKYLSDRLLFRVSFLLEEPENNLQQAQAVYAEAWADDARSDLINDLGHECGYLIKPGNTINGLAKQVALTTTTIKNALTQIKLFDNKQLSQDLSKINIGDVNPVTWQQLLKQLTTVAVISPDNDAQTPILPAAAVFLQQVQKIIITL